MFNKKTLIVDIDDTIVNFGQQWVYALNSKYNTNVNWEDVTDWDMSLFFPTLSKDQVYSVFKDEDFYKDVCPKYDAYHYLKLLKSEGYKIVLCTSSYYGNLKNKLEDCIFKWFDFLSWENIVVCKDKSVMRGDMMIDDGVHNLWSFKGIKVLVDAPHNQDTYIDKYVANKDDSYRRNEIIRRRNWKEIYETVHKECPIK